jgi:hypothetical protein
MRPPMIPSPMNPTFMVLLPSGVSRNPSRTSR